MAKNKGFTLLELLVVISVIGLLSSIIITNTGPARENARDARRRADLDAISKALELFYNDYGHYPMSNECGTEGQECTYNYPCDHSTVRCRFESEADAGYPCLGLWVYFGTNPQYTNRLIRLLNDYGYLNSYFQDPQDPDGDKHLYYYYTDITGQHFTLMASLENPTNRDIATQLLEPPATDDCSCSKYPTEYETNCYRIAR